MKYGSAGDCYTADKTPRGAFSICLDGTGFRVSPKTTWIQTDLGSVVEIHKEASSVYSFLYLLNE